MTPADSDSVVRLPAAWSHLQPEEIARRMDKDPVADLEAMTVQELDGEYERRMAAWDEEDRLARDRETVEQRHLRLLDSAYNSSLGEEAIDQHWLKEAEAALIAAGVRCSDEQRAADIAAMRPFVPKDLADRYPA